MESSSENPVAFGAHSDGNIAETPSADLLCGIASGSWGCEEVSVFHRF